jgi:predicted N-acetyltransferase YhbS
MTSLTFRQLTPADMPAVSRLEAEAFVPSLRGADATLARLIDLFPEGAIGCFDERGLCGFALGVPLSANATIDLAVPLEAVPAGADTFYIHDVAVAPRCAGRGFGRALAERLIGVGRRLGFRRFDLVSVQGSAPFWERFGFRRVHDFEYAPGAASTKMVMWEENAGV